MDAIARLIPGIRAFRPFLPAKEYETSLRFYKAIGFEAYPLRDRLAELSLGTHAFILQDYYVKEWADNTMMHVPSTTSTRGGNTSILAKQFAVSAPAAPRAEPWGLTVAYVVDPSGVLWHFAEPTKSDV